MVSGGGSDTVGSIVGFQGRMSLSFRTALCAAAIGCAALTASAHAQAPGEDRSDARAKAALEQAKAALSDPSAAPQEDLTLALIELSQAIPDLEGADGREANAILARPDDGPDDRYGDGFTADEAPESPECNSGFCVHWVDTTKDKPDPEDSNGLGDGDGVPDYVEEVLLSALESHETENTDLGWSEPVGDADRGGGPPNATDIYLLDIDKFYYGYASPDEGQGSATSKWAYLVLDDDYERLSSPPEFTGIEAMQVTMAHEYNHVLQFAADSQEDLWMFESTATWMEDMVYPDIDDYIGYLPFYASAVKVPLTGNTKDGLKIYGAAVWNHFLEAANPDTIRDAWNVSTSTDNPSLSVAAYDDALGGSGNPYEALSQKFGQFASSSVEWRSQSAVYEDATEFPDIKRRGKLKPGDPRKLKLDHLSYALLDIPVNVADEYTTLEVKAPDGTFTTIGIYGREGNATSGSITSQSVVSVPEGGEPFVGMAGGDFDRVTALVANGDAEVNSAGTKYKRDNQKFKVKLSPGP